MTLHHQRPVTQRKRRLGILLLCALQLSHAPVGHSQALDLNLPELGNPSILTVSRQEEKKIGESFYRKLREAGLVEDDPIISNYIKDIGIRILNAAQVDTRDFTFFGVADTDVNAFAAPGGYIGINAGLILAMETEAELAAVVAHEIAHVTQRHLVRHYEATADLNLGLAAALLAAVLLGGGSGETREALIYGGLGATARANINFTREHEQEADRVGIEYLKRAGYPGIAMADTFRRLHALSRFGATIPEFLRSHPVNESRIADAQARAGSQALSSKPWSIEDTNFEIIKSLLVARNTENHEERAAELAQALQSGRYRNKPATEFAYAVSLEKLGKLQQAESLISELLTNDNNRPIYHLVHARILNAMKRPTEARESLVTALDLFPGNYAVRLATAEHLNSTGDFQKAYLAYRSLVQDFPDDPAIREALASSAFEIGNKDEAYLERAEAHILNGRYDEARESLKLAERAPSSNVAIVERIAERNHEITQRSGIRERTSGEAEKAKASY